MKALRSANSLLLAVVLAAVAAAGFTVYAGTAPAPQAAAQPSGMSIPF